MDSHRSELHMSNMNIFAFKMNIYTCLRVRRGSHALERERREGGGEKERGRGRGSDGTVCSVVDL